MNFKIYTLVFVVGLVAFFGMALMHEYVHKEIFRGYGIDSRIEVDWSIMGMVVIPEEPCPTEACNLARDINEAISYPLFPFAAFLIIVFSIICGEVSDRYD